MITPQLKLEFLEKVKKESLQNFSNSTHKNEVIEAEEHLLEDLKNI